MQGNIVEIEITVGQVPHAQSRTYALGDTVREIFVDQRAIHIIFRADDGKPTTSHVYPLTSVRDYVVTYAH